MLQVNYNVDNHLNVTLDKFYVPINLVSLTNLIVQAQLFALVDMLNVMITHVRLIVKILLLLLLKSKKKMIN